MKIRAFKNIHDTDKTYEEFKLTEFSKDLTEFIPDTSISCNECSKKEDETKPVDSVLSFLVKFKADKLSDPKRVKKDGVSGIELPTDKKYKYVKEKGDASFFTSVRENHFNLQLNEEEVEEVAKYAFNKYEKSHTFNPDEVSSYLISRYETKEWRNLFADSKKKNWKKFLKQSLKSHFKKTYCELDKAELERMLDTDPEGLKKCILKLNEFDCFIGSEKNEIRRALGQNFI